MKVKASMNSYEFIFIDIPKPLMALYTQKYIQVKTRLTN